MMDLQAFAREAKKGAQRLERRFLRLVDLEVLTLFCGYAKIASKGREKERESCASKGCTGPLKLA